MIMSNIKSNHSVIVINILKSFQRCDLLRIPTANRKPWSSQTNAEMSEKSVGEPTDANRTLHMLFDDVMMILKTYDSYL